MTEAWRLVQAEASKVARRRFSWALAVGLILASILHARSLRTSLLDYQQAIESGVGRHGQAIPRQIALVQEAEMRRRMTLPAALDEVWVVTGSWGVFALLIAACIQTGEEFDAGTGRTILLRGTGRTAWPIAKALAYLGMTGLMWIVLAFIQIPVGFWLQAQSGAPVGLTALQLVDWPAFAGRLLRAWTATLPYIGFATGIAWLARGAGPALALSLGIRFVETVSDAFGPFLVSMKLSGVGSFSTLYGLWAPLHVVSMNWNAKVWTAWGGAIWSEALSVLPGGAPERLPPPFHTDPLLAGSILMLWSVVWIGVGAWALNARDVAA